MTNSTDEANEPDRASALSRFLMSQIDARIQQGVAAAGPPPEYYVIRSEATGVLSVLAACTLGDEQRPIKGPASFADCIAHVNAQMVYRQAACMPPPAPAPKEPQ